METRVHPLLSCAQTMGQKILRAKSAVEVTPFGRVMGAVLRDDYTSRFPELERSRGSRPAPSARLHATASRSHRSPQSATNRKTTAAAEPRVWARNVGALAFVGTLGLALAGAATTAGSASPFNWNPTPAQVSVDPNVQQPAAFDQRAAGTSRTAERDALAARNSALEATRQQTSQVSTKDAAAARTKLLGAAATQTKKVDQQLQSTIPDRMPLSNYTMSARWGAVGAWASYHTGVDLAAPMGTTIVAPISGVVVHAGFGGAAGSWAGAYVVLQHKDGSHSLYAHMNPTMSVSVGEQVTPGTVLGAVSTTGRSFGPHLHLEYYPAGATWGNIYTTTDPMAWLNQRL